MTNDVRPLATPGAAPVYAALVTPKGKLLHDIFILRGDDSSPAAAAGQQSAAGAAGAEGGEPQPPNRLLLDVDAAGAQGVLQWLARYKLRRPIKLEDASSDLSVWARYGGSGSSSSGSSSGGAQPAAAAGWFVDPRLPNGELGERGVLTASAVAAAAAGGGDSSWRSAPEAQHKLLRYRLGVAEGDAEMPSGERLRSVSAAWHAFCWLGRSFSRGFHSHRCFTTPTS